MESAPPRPQMLARTAVGLVAVGAIGGLDSVTGADIAFSLFYLMPIMWVGVGARNGPVLVVAFAASVAWLVNDALIAHYDAPVAIWNALSRLVVFAVVGVLVATIGRERDQLRALSRRLEHLGQREAALARTDALTGIPNARAFYEALARELERSGRVRRPLTVVYIDLDDFKGVNDHYGHSVGDEVLRMIADELRECVREGDVVGRLGGDELAVLLPGADERIAEAVARRFHERLRGLVGRYARAALGASIGVATWDGAGPAPSADELVRQADTAMYQGKRGHKGGVVVAQRA